MKIYISIPISNNDISIQKAKADEIAGLIRNRKHTPVNPFETPPPPEEYNSDQKYAYYMGRDIEQLLLCDAIFMCEGWAYSKGCCMEKALAHINNMIIINSKEQLAKL